MLGVQPQYVALGHRAVTSRAIDLRRCGVLRVAEHNVVRLFMHPPRRNRLWPLPFRLHMAHAALRNLRETGQFLFIHACVAARALQLERRVCLMAETARENRYGSENATSASE